VAAQTLTEANQQTGQFQVEQEHFWPVVLQQPVLFNV
jgi:hypothetical protein